MRTTARQSLEATRQQKEGATTRAPIQRHQSLALLGAVLFGAVCGAAITACAWSSHNRGLGVREQSLDPRLEVEGGRLHEETARRLGEARSTRHESAVYDGVHSVMREWGCGHGNMVTPRLVESGGVGEVIVDVGLGTDAKETLDAVIKGFIVLAFEPMPYNMATIRRSVRQRALHSHVTYIEMKRAADGSWRMPPLPMPRLRGQNQVGHAYIINAAVGAEDGTVKLPATSATSGALGSIVDSVNDGTPVPQVKLDTVLPEWAANVLLLKIDTQGYELRVLRGAVESLRARRFTYVLYELSPWLMIRGGLGDPQELLRLMPEMNALCFDMMVRCLPPIAAPAHPIPLASANPEPPFVGSPCPQGLHNLFPRRGYPLDGYFAELHSGNNSYIPMDADNGVGPWDDIMCWFPGSERRSALGGRAAPKKLQQLPRTREFYAAIKAGGGGQIRQRASERRAAAGVFRPSERQARASRFPRTNKFFQ